MKELIKLSALITKMNRIGASLERAFGIKKNERILIVTDTRMDRELVEMFFKSAKKLSENIKLVTMEPIEKDGTEPPEHVAHEMINSSVALLLTTKSLSHTEARRDASKNGARIASLPGFTAGMIDALTVDGMQIRKSVSHLPEMFRISKSIHVTSPSGTDLFMKIGSRLFIDDGILTEPGSFSNLPAGEVYLLPRDAKGVLVIDSFKNIITKPAKAEIKANKVVGVEGEQGRRLMAMLEYESYREVAEFGIGINPKAKITGKTLMDEKCLGTCHVAFGDNASFGGSNNVPVHFDTIVFRPTIMIDEKIIMKSGKPMWAC